MSRPLSTALGLFLLALSAVASAQPPARPRAGDVEPKVLSADEAAKRSRSPLLGGDADRYGDTTWAELPPWKRTTFYGVRARAQTVVFVVDCSESMADEARLVRAKSELRRSVMGLQFPQQFMVIFYNDEPLPMPGSFLKSADLPEKDTLIRWLRLIEPDGGTDPRAAMQLAIGLNPDAIYLLSDGLFPDGTAEAIAARNRKKIPIHCIDLSGGAAGDHLARIARESGGRYAPKP